MSQTRIQPHLQQPARAGMLIWISVVFCLLLVLWTPAKWSVQQNQITLAEARLLKGFPLHYTYLLPYNSFWVALQPDRNDLKTDPPTDPVIWQPTLTQVQKFALVAVRAVHEVWIDVPCTISLFGKQQLDAP